MANVNDTSGLGTVPNFCVPVTNDSISTNLFLEKKFQEKVVFCDRENYQVRILSDIREKDHIKKAVGMFSYISNSDFKYVKSYSTKNGDFLYNKYVCQGRHDVTDKVNR